ncbi:MAG TPA: hypothetical protein VGS79_21795 [Puia sp.]|nr:hypothetical protein [Puia sp.]
MKFYATGYEISYRHTDGNTASIYFFNPSFAADLFFAFLFAHPKPLIVAVGPEIQKYRQ